MRAIASFIRAHAVPLTIAAVIIIYLVAVALIFFKTANHSGAYHVSGAWLTLASDLADGVFYRDLFSSDRGLGGTRFFPVTFVLQSVPIALGISPLVSGHIIAVVTGIAFLGIVFLFLRRLSDNRLLIAAVAGLLLLTGAVNIGFSATRGDVLPVLFNLAGLYWMIYRGRTDASRVHGGTLFFLCAFATKVTSISGVVTAVIWLWGTGDRRRAFQMTLLFLAGAILLVGLFYLLSGGRILDIFMTCSTARPDIIFALSAPIHFMGDALNDDFTTVALGIVAAVSFIFSCRSRVALPVHLYFFVSLLQTIIIFASPGIDANHLIDVAVASALVICMNFSADNCTGAMRFRIAAAVAVTGLFCLLPVVRDLKQEAEVYLADEGRFNRSVIERLSRYDRILCEDPTLPLALGKSVYLQDAFMYKFIVETHPEAQQAMFSLLRHRSFNAVVLLQDPETAPAYWYDPLHFNPAFIRVLLENYQNSGQIGQYVLFLPKENTSR